MAKRTPIFFVEEKLQIMSDCEEKGSKRQKTSNDNSVGVSGTVRECVLALMEAVIAWTSSFAAALQRVKTAATTANHNGKTPVTSNTTQMTNHLSDQLNALLL